jgi:hypothetical protein
VTRDAALHALDPVPHDLLDFSESISESSSCLLKEELQHTLEEHWREIS